MIAFVDAEDTRAQRDAALNILQRLKNFFGTEDLIEIDDKITDERLTETNGLPESQTERVRKLIVEAEGKACQAQNLIVGEQRFG